MQKEPYNKRACWSGTPLLQPLKITTQIVIITSGYGRNQTLIYDYYYYYYYLFGIKLQCQEQSKTIVAMENAHKSHKTYFQ